MVGSFYDPDLDEGCAFEELISFHGGLGGPQTRPFILHPEHLPLPDEPIVGAAAVHGAALGLAGRCSRARLSARRLRPERRRPVVDQAGVSLRGRPPRRASEASSLR